MRFEGVPVLTLVAGLDCRIVLQPLERNICAARQAETVSSSRQSHQRALDHGERFRPVAPV